ncbi:MAG: hypothetical protein FWD89_03445 [Firmicutes bacterium]|nr:hypothetical protein [Bacillota bacterium]MCL2771344.1 hypothetical protein [Bacillota bacterium]
MEYKDFEYKTNNKASEQKAKDLLNKYKGMDEGMLLEQIKQQIKKTKSDGSFDKEKILSEMKKYAFVFGQEGIERMEKLLDEN